MPTYRAVEAAVVQLDGHVYALDPARTVDSDDPEWAPVLAAYPAMFGRFIPVEQATAAPGERRNAKRPARG